MSVYASLPGDKATGLSHKGIVCCWIKAIFTFTIFVPQSESQNWSCVSLNLHDDKKKTFCSSGTDRYKTTIYFYPRSTKNSINSNVL